jgi:hypothetical protein
VEGVNPEINTDKRVLLSRMEELGFRPDIVKALEELDRKVYAAEKPLDFKSCMDLARTIFEEIVEDAGRRAVAVKGISLPPASVKGNFSPWKKLLVETGVLPGADGEFFQSFYNYLSTAGAHRLGSQPEQVRVARNIVIEVGLLVVGRVQALIGAARKAKKRLPAPRSDDPFSGIAASQSTAPLPSALPAGYVASLMLQQGESPVYVQRQLGQSSIKLTVDTYGKAPKWYQKQVRALRMFSKCPI